MRQGCAVEQATLGLPGTQSCMHCMYMVSVYSRQDPLTEVGDITPASVEFFILGLNSSGSSSQTV